ncbi:Fic family protein, partial [Candidatus Gottesmanbacteria bacterium]|nr:Fic family protein [Candidatus Gottesmanbacteria bacterium]
MKYLANGVKKRLEEKLLRLNKLRPLPASAVKKLREQFKIEMAYNSNAIEGNSLTLRETYLVITEGLTIKNKPLKDHLEAKDHYEALDYLFKLVENKKPIDISEEVILSLHKIVVLDTEKDWAGKYRNSWVMITGTNYFPPEASEIPSLMKEVVNWFEQNKKKLH